MVPIIEATEPGESYVGKVLDVLAADVAAIAAIAAAAAAEDDVEPCTDVYGKE